MEDNVTGEQSDLGPYCLQYKLHKSYICTYEHQQTREADDKWLNTGSFEEKKLHNSNLILCVFCKTNV